jgi:hypothetical protein
MRQAYEERLPVGEDPISVPSRMHGQPVPLNRHPRRLVTRREDTQLDRRPLALALDMRLPAADDVALGNGGHADSDPRS